MGLARRHLLGDFQNLKKINRRFVCQVARTSRLKKAVINREFVLPIVYDDEWWSCSACSCWQATPMRKQLSMWLSYAGQLH